MDILEPAVLLARLVILELAGHLVSLVSAVRRVIPELAENLGHRVQAECLEVQGQAAAQDIQELAVLLVSQASAVRQGTLVIQVLVDIPGPAELQDTLVRVAPQEQAERLVPVVILGLAAHPARLDTQAFPALVGYLELLVSLVIAGKVVHQDILAFLVLLA